MLLCVLHVSIKEAQWVERERAKENHALQEKVHVHVCIVNMHVP